MNEEQPSVKECKGDGTPGSPTVFVATEGHTIMCTTPEHMAAEQIPLEQYLRQVVDQARAFGDSIFRKYEDGGEIGWFPDL
jgi:hypothetical protein